MAVKQQAFAIEQHLDCKQGAVRNVNFNIDGNYCMTGGSDRTIKLWNPYRAVLLQTFLGHGSDVMDVRGSCDNALLCSASNDRSIMLWDVSTAKSTRKWRGHHGPANCCYFNETSTVVISGSVDGSVCAWDCRSKSRDPVQKMKEAKDSVTSVCVGQYEILVASLDGCVRRYDIRIGKLFVDSLGSPATRVLLSRDGLCFLVSCLGGVLRLMDKQSGDCLQEFKGHVNREFYLDAAFSENDLIVYSGSEDGKVISWNLLEGDVLQKLTHPTSNPVHSISHHPDKPCLLTATKGVVYLWRVPEDSGD